MRGFVILTGAVVLFVFCAFRNTGIDPMHTQPAGIVSKDTLKLDAESGLVVDESLYLVKAQCATVCHSSQLIRANRFTRDGWQQKIRWMQANHNLWELGETEKTILDYLEKYYAPTQSNGRRAPLKNIQWYKLTKS